MFELHLSPRSYLLWDPVLDPHAFITNSLVLICHFVSLDQLFKIDLTVVVTTELDLRTPWTIFAL